MQEMSKGQGEQGAKSVSSYRTLMCVWVQQPRDVVSCFPAGCLRGWGNSERYQRPHPIDVLYDNDGYDDDDDDADE